ncbi:hypothetical protein [Simplicispira piscis]
MTTQDQAQAPGATGATTEDEALDLGNDDLPSTGGSETAAPALAPAQAAAPASDASSGEGTGSTQNVPYARFREVNENKRLLEEQLAAMQQELQAIKAGQQLAAAPSPAAAPAPAPAAFDVDAAEEQYAQALLDGDAKAASAIRREINQHIENSVMQRFEQTSLQQQVVVKSQDVVARALEAYPWLDQDEGAIALELIEASVKAKTATGMPRHLALADAIQTIAPRFAPDGTPSRALPNGGAPVDTRLERADKRGAADSLLQPAAVQAGMGNRATAPKIDDSTKLTDDQITNLSKDEMAKALGIG